METYIGLCCSFSVPLWVSPLLHAASRLKTDPARRRKAYRLIQRQLNIIQRFHRQVRHEVGFREFDDKPTYIYPPELKEMIRAAFPGDICNYDDPRHENVYVVTMDDLNKLT